MAKSAAATTSISVQQLVHSEKERRNSVEYFLQNRLRVDDRKAEEFRKLAVNVGVVSSAKGSAYLECGQTKILCMVFGPREVQRGEQEFDISMQGQLDVELRFAPFATRERFKRERDQLTDAERELASIVCDALRPSVCLEKIPKSQLDIRLTVLEDDGGVLAGALTASTMAIADAGIEMFDLVVGAQLCCLSTPNADGEVYFLDPNADEERDLRAFPLAGKLTVGLMPSLNQVCSMYQTGALAGNTQLINSFRMANVAAMKLLPVLRETLAKSARLKFPSAARE